MTNIANHIKTFLTLMLLLIFINTFSQDMSVSPTRLYFDNAPGETKNKTVKITNNSEQSISFNIKFSDFSATGNKGKSDISKTINEDDPNGLAKYLSVSPTFIELGPKEIKDVNVSLYLPADPESENVKWAAMSIVQTKERISPSEEKDASKMGMGIVPVMGFVIHIFQTPPSVAKNIDMKKAQIISFKQIYNEADSNYKFILEAENIGKAILDCASFVELTNLNTGKNQRLKPIPFTLLPNARREVIFSIPNEFPKGKYSVMGIIDYRGKEVEAAEIEDFIIK
ncbi:MAG: hypothetical protein A2X12_00595 [Bacteroidetes bacterium GWE2_29_8]|nr:MAG: hypothetical protein A2X12_00595 [Bacteroidetes bacterium GWE2_29_8]OFY17436.1 MAG: hypothetical protein A2X02_00890 [Bacteroidetes bacterium GWF2_29_10]